MTARRQARAGGSLSRDVGMVPPELANPDDPTWSERAEVEHLAQVYGVDYVEPAPSLLRDPYFERFKAFRAAYARRHGLTAEDEVTLDLKRLRAAGIFAGSRGPRWRLLTGGEVVPYAPGGPW